MNAVRAQSVMSERGVAQKMEVGGILWDMADFYEHFDSEVLMDRAKATEFPERAAVVAVDNLNGCASAAHAKCGNEDPSALFHRHLLLKLQRAS